ncbi:glycosyltransferase family 2 protein [Halovulum sp. GXIMD14793]
MSDLSLVFATIDRAYAAERLILSARRYFPDLQILVAEQTDTPTPLAAFCTDLGVRHLSLPHDSGVTVARNALVRAVETPFFVLCDDDFVLTEATDFAPALHIMHHNPQIGVVGGRLWDIHSGDTRHPRHWEMFLNLDREHGTLTALPIQNLAPIAGQCGPYRYLQCDAVLNFAVMRRAMFSDMVRWDPQFRCNGEHEDFYLTLKHHSDFKVVYYPGMVADHHHISSPAYARLRDRAEGWQAFMEKWQITQHLEVDEALQTRDAPGRMQPAVEAREGFAKLLNPAGPNAARTPNMC